MKVILAGFDDLVGRWVMDKTGGTWSPGRGIGFGLYDEPAGQVLAGVLFEGWNGASMLMHVAAVPGASWMNRGYLHTCFDYAFNQVKVTKLIGLVGEKNEAARRFDEHIGFVLEATLKDAHPDGDQLIYTMRRDQCRWLDMRIPPNGKTIRTPAA